MCRQRQHRPLRNRKVKTSGPGVKWAAEALQRGGLERQRDTLGCPDESRDAEQWKHSRKLCLEPELETITDILRLSTQFSSANIDGASTPCQVLGASHQDTSGYLQPPAAPGGGHKATVQWGWARMHAVHRGACCLPRAAWSGAQGRGLAKPVVPGCLSWAQGAPFLRKAFS